MDFFESYPEQIYEVKEPDSTKTSVLATVSGPFFFPNFPSRNKRVYPEKAWENALNNPYTVRQMGNGLMLGTVGHKEMEFDDLIAEQKVSHVTRKLWVEDNNGRFPDIKSDRVGMGEADILDTPVGRILNTLIRANCKLGVSSKSFGDYNAKDNLGNQIVDENKFFCQRFDFVVDPGYLQAMPQLKEAFESLEEYLHPAKKEEVKIEEKNDNENMEDFIMDEKMIKLIEEKAALENQLSNILMENKSLRESVVTFEKFGTVDTIKQLQENLATYSAIGTVESIKESLAAFASLQKELEDIGTVEEITDALTQAKESLEAVREFGSVEDIKEAFELVEALEEIGTIEEIQEAFENTKILTEQLAEIGTVKEIKEALEGSKALVEQYQEIGTVEQITEAFEKAQTFLGSLKENAHKDQVQQLVTEFKMTEEKAEKMLAKMSLEEAKELLSTMAEDLKESVKVERHYGRKMDEKKIDETDTPIKGRTTRLFENFGSPVTK
jgi:tetratricopeptide (TPR) repeat protein